MTLQSGGPQVFQIVHPTVTAVQCRGSYVPTKNVGTQDDNEKAG
ncbi:MAG: hypothetical protein WBW71_08025 [Bacteroidota bacterium]